MIRSLVLLMLVAAACEGRLVETRDSGATGTTAPAAWTPGGSAVIQDGRRIRRLSARQYVDSLEVATGQAWADFARYSAAMGEPDLAENTEVVLAPSVAFVKLAEDAAAATCSAAIDADADRLPSDRVLLRHAELNTTDNDAYRQNLRYLALRFWSLDIATADARLDPWLALLTEAAPSSAAARRERWLAVCVGFATHENFLVY